MPIVGQPGLESPDIAPQLFHARPPGQPPAGVDAVDAQVWGQTHGMRDGDLGILTIGVIDDAQPANRPPLMVAQKRKASAQTRPVGGGNRRRVGAERHQAGLVEFDLGVERHQPAELETIPGTEKAAIHHHDQRSAVGKAEPPVKPVRGGQLRQAEGPAGVVGQGQIGKARTGLKRCGHACLRE